MTDSPQVVLPVPIPQSMADVIARFGDISAYIDDQGNLSPDWESDTIVRVKLPIATPVAGALGMRNKIAVHELLVDHVAAMYAEIAKAGLWSALGPFGGDFDYRPNKNDASKLSLHCWGIAFDWDPEKFPNGSLNRRDPNLTAIMLKYGFRCGQDFLHTKDPMHFEYANGAI